MRKCKYNLKRCEQCGLIKTATAPVNGCGKSTSKVMFVGEAPGANEDREGVPFIGAAGKKLDVLLDSVGLNRNDIYITNIVKCRPPKNADPTKRQIRICQKYLYEEIAMLIPKVIVPLGRYSGEWVAKRLNLEFTTISNMHGRSYTTLTPIGKISTLFMYHPACALYNPEMIDTLLKDIAEIKKLL